MGIYPFDGIDKYWKYKNPDPSTAYYGAILSDEIISSIQETIEVRGKRIYNVRPKAIIVQDLHFEVIRQLAKKLFDYVKEIDRFEKENSGDIRNYLVDTEDEDEDEDEKGGNHNSK